ncbi:MAG: MCP four helix bundle domain-containing protein [Clostridia bacterium]|nr:MCP four helix bundle domain-containing protein [Clostridia bacterium]
MSFINNMKIGKRLVLGFVIVALIAGAVGLVGYLGLSKIRSTQDEIALIRLPSIQSLLAIKEAQTAVITGERGLQIAQMRDKSLRDPQYAYIESAIARALEAWDVYTPLPQTDYEAEQWKIFVPQWDQWIKDDAAVVALAKQKDSLIASGASYDSQEAKALDQQVYEAALVARTSYLQTEATLRNLIQENIDEADRVYNLAQKSAVQSTILLIVIIVIAIILAIVLGLFISRLISKPINSLVKIAGRLADGDLNLSVNATSKDEIGDLMGAFEVLINSLNDTLSEINNAAEQVSAGASQVSDGSQELSQGSTEQASSVEELTASVSQIASQTKENANNANEANRITLEVKSNATRGNEQMTGMLNSMKDINESSQNISKIIKVIDDIAFQTNLLALNAAVEAARAGQHGKGFAVVAEEVRNLAARSANAAKETTALIEGSISKVETGTKIANETAKALEDIVKGVEKASSLVSQITSASNEQATGVSQINEGLEQVSKVVQSNSATAEESAAASEELSSQAELLKDRVAKFKLKGESNSRKPAKPVKREVKQIRQTKEPVINLDDNSFGKY